ncbi:M28 family peptidase [Allosphingosinicella sp.]|uniref:M28 family peptidase n=1 Tax=Allosphingosinicella sp. TaxID=2823234 RepID=UPI0037852BFB
MFKTLIRAAALLFVSCSAPLAAQGPVTPADLLRHIRVLASDEYQGRAPGTDGERRTTAYIVEQFRARGLEPAGENGTWFQTLHLASRRPETATVGWTGTQPGQLGADDIVVTGRSAHEVLADAPLIFAAHGARLPDRGIDQLAGANVQGAVVLILFDGPQVEGFPPIAERVRTVAAAGAAAVIVVIGPEVPWDQVRNVVRRGALRPDDPSVPRFSAVMPMAAAQRMVAGAGGDMARLLNEQPGSSFRAVTLPGRVSIDATTAVNRIETSNVIGRLRGTGTTGENVMLLAHWDHLGLCRPEGAPDRICNGAVDNASGIAGLIETAGQLSRGDHPVRDVLFMATTAEEVGLVGAGWYGDHPTVPLTSILAAINMDTIAIAPAGTPVAIMPSNTPGLNALAASTVTAAGRALDPDDEAAELVRRQDGWALARHGVPTLMIGGSFSNMTLLGNFLEHGRYHSPDDQADSQLVLDGAAEDMNLTVALVRRIADPSVYQRPQPIPAQRPAQ